MLLPLAASVLDAAVVVWDTVAAVAGCGYVLVQLGQYGYEVTAACLCGYAWPAGQPQWLCG